MGRPSALRLSEFKIFLASKETQGPKMELGSRLSREKGRVCVSGHWDLLADTTGTEDVCQLLSHSGNHRYDEAPQTEQIS